jgi:cytochrome c-type biogenesis protein
MNFIIPAFIAGLITFFAPCTLPLVPVYASLISGLSTKESGPAVLRHTRTRVWIHSLCFILGFTTVFIFFGTFAGLLGGALGPARPWFIRFGGAFVALAGLGMLEAIKLPGIFSRSKFLSPSFFSNHHSPATLAAIGAAFGLGWSPCIGPVLATILFLASQSGSAQKGALLLLVFSAGLAFPFLLVTATIHSAMARIGAITEFIARFRVLILGIAGVGIGFLGILSLVGMSILVENVSGIRGFASLPRKILTDTPLLIPLCAAILFGIYAKRHPAIDIIRTISGWCLLLLGILLLSGNYGLVMQYIYDTLPFIKY